MNFHEIFGSAEFITPSAPCNLRIDYPPIPQLNFGTLTSYDNCSVPYIRGEFKTHKKVKKAELTACGLGLVELYLNGARVSDDLFVPAVSDYHFTEAHVCYKKYGELTSHRIHCLRYDVTDMISESNCIGAALSIGWYSVKVYGKIKLAFRVDITYEDGTTDEYLSGEQLKWTYSPIEVSHFLFGERHNYDAHRLDGWNTVGFDDSAWESVEKIAAPESNYDYQDCPVDRVIRCIEPKCIGETEDVYIYDMGENITGTPVIEAVTDEVTTIELDVSERLKDGMIEAYTNHRQHAVFVTDGSPRRYHLRFCWFGFRYASVTKNARITSCAVIHSDVKVTSDFKSSNAQLNWMYDAYIRTQLDNMHMSIPSDCPHCEKRGYTGDGQLTCECAMMMLDAQKFYRKWLYDISDCQDTVSGHVQNTAPYLPSGGGPGGWGSAIAEVPYMYYRTYGDLSVAEEFLPKIYRYFDYLEAHSENDIVVSDNSESCLGDWCAPDGAEASDDGSIATPSQYVPLMPAAYVNTYFYVKAVLRAVEMCKALGRHGDIPALLTRAERKKAAIIRDFYDSATGDFCSNHSSANVFAIDLGLGDERTLAHVAEHFEREPWYNTGIFGTDIATRVLFTHGHADIAYKLLTGDGKCSFGRWMRDGHTTFPEYWTYQRSQNHPMFGAVVRYLFKYILGITETGAGYDELVIEPLCMDMLSSASGHITTRHGKVAVSYSVSDSHISVEVEIPSGCSARFRHSGTEYALNAGVNRLVLK
ncbi:MAG: family 78 glycoside hydrolase catalytic domain [Clostridia bacterium]|nr:family 78 glycoside hydrolase catalytic domain [Clostridia bacterium]